MSHPQSLHMLWRSKRCTLPRAYHCSVCIALGPCLHRSSRATVFLFDDTQLVNESFLEDVNGILNTGEVPSLFNNEEMVAINEALTKPAQVCQLMCVD